MDRIGHSRESNFQAMVMPPISESLKRNKKVPSGLLMSRSWACCLFTKPRMALGARSIRRHCRAGSHCPLGPCPSHCRAHCFSPVIPMGLVMLLQHLHDPIEPLPEGIVPARQVLLRSPRKPQVRACAPVITGGPANNRCPLIFTQTLSQFLILFVPHSAAPNPYPREPESTHLWPLRHRGLRQPHGVGVGGAKNCLSWMRPAQSFLPSPFISQMGKRGTEKGGSLAN